MDVATTVKLTAKEENFVFALGYGLPPTRSAKVAGWSIGSASRLIHKPHIRAALLAVHENTGQILDKLAKREGSVGEVEPGA